MCMLVLHCGFSFVFGFSFSFGIGPSRITFFTAAPRSCHRISLLSPKRPIARKRCLIDLSNLESFHRYEWVVFLLYQLFVLAFMVQVCKIKFCTHAFSRLRFLSNWTGYVQNYSSKVLFITKIKKLFFSDEAYIYRKKFPNNFCRYSYKKFCRTICKKFLRLLGPQKNSDEILAGNISYLYN